MFFTLPLVVNIHTTHINKIDSHPLEISHYTSFNAPKYIIVHLQVSTWFAVPNLSSVFEEIPITKTKQTKQPRTRSPGRRQVCKMHGMSLPWWRHQMKTFSALLAICAGNSPVSGEFPAQRPVTRSFDVFFDQRPNKRLSKQSWVWWFETHLSPLWRHSNAVKWPSRHLNSPVSRSFIPQFLPADIAS